MPYDADVRSGRVLTSVLVLVMVAHAVYSVTPNNTLFYTMQKLLASAYS